MASAWGKSWGMAFGAAWGVIGASAPVRQPARGGSYARAHRRTGTQPDARRLRSRRERETEDFITLLGR